MLGKLLNVGLLLAGVCGDSGQHSDHQPTTPSVHRHVRAATITHMTTGWLPPLAASPTLPASLHYAHV
jgi:hypothetical protein